MIRMVVTLAVVGSVALSVTAMDDSAATDNLSAAVGSATSAVHADAAPTYEYIGSSKCKMCHSKEHKSWKKTKMANAFDTLKPGHAAEQKKKFNLDPNKDYTTDSTCLKCHTTGFGHEGGYSIPDAADKKQVKKARKLQGVGCESCHGPGSVYYNVFMDIFRTKRQYTQEELYAVGLNKMGAAVCTVCHNADGPTHDPTVPFDFATMKA
ncbi:MAG: cytochrome c family protein, partial [Planctomycetes bacterium]|nr:cytochrome c family protein [Planctomycetota bacterium]